MRHRLKANWLTIGGVPPKPHPSPVCRSLGRYCMIPSCGLCTRCPCYHYAHPHTTAELRKRVARVCDHCSMPLLSPACLRPRLLNPLSGPYAIHKPALLLTSQRVQCCVSRGRGLHAAATRQVDCGLFGPEETRRPRTRQAQRACSSLSNRSPPTSPGSPFRWGPSCHGKDGTFQATIYFLKCSLFFRLPRASDIHQRMFSISCSFTFKVKDIRHNSDFHCPRNYKLCTSSCVFFFFYLLHVKRRRAP